MDYWTFSKEFTIRRNPFYHCPFYHFPRNLNFQQSAVYSHLNFTIIDLSIDWNQSRNQVTTFGLTWIILVSFFIISDFNIAQMSVEILSSMLIQLYHGSSDGIAYTVKHMVHKLWWTHLHSKIKNIFNSNQSQAQKCHFYPKNIRSKFTFIFL